MIPACLAALGAAAFADNVVLTGDGRLSGTVRGIGEGGVVELASELSDKPVKLKASAVDKVEFQPEALPASSGGAIVELTNGDRLPVALGDMDGTRLAVNSIDMGSLAIPLKALKSLQVGVHPRRVIYSGPGDASEWTNVGQTAGWKLNDGALVANGSATAARQFDLPRQFTIKFTLKWEGNPNFQLTFADPLTAKADAMDRYVFQFNPGGFEIHREASKGKRMQTVIAPGRGAEQFYPHEVAVEIRVDRKAGRIGLFLNGEQEYAGIDSLPDTPTGSGMIISNMAPAGTNQQIRDIEVVEYDSSTARHRTEERGDPNMDSLISRDDDRWGGHLQSIRGGADGAVFLFKSDFQDQPQEISEKDVSTVFFAKPADAPADSAVNPFVLKLRGDGSLHVTSCRLEESGITVVHPLLGELKIARAGLAALEKSNPPAVKEAAK